MANCSICYAPYSRTSPEEYWEKGASWLFQPWYNTEKDQIKVIAGKSLLTKIPVNYNAMNVEFISFGQVINVDLQDEIISVDRKLKQLASLIEDSKYLLSLKAGWDEENARPVDPDIWKSAAKFLIQCAADIFDSTDRVIEMPEINPCKDGSIDLSWRTKKARMLINFRKENNLIMAYYYGDFYRNKNAFKGSVSAEVVEPWVRMWMMNLTE